MAVSLVAKYIYKSGYAWKDSLNNFSMRRYFVQYTLPVKLLSAIFEVMYKPQFLKVFDSEIDSIRMVRKIRISYTNGCYLAVTFFKSMKGLLIVKKNDDPTAPTGT